jgi:hypothetical protein
MRGLLLAALVSALLTAGTASAAQTRPKPARFKDTPTTCATYASPAIVQKLTGIAGTPQKGPSGQCHFIVNGSKDALQINIWQTGTAVKARALLQETFTGSSGQSGDCANADAATPTPCGTQYLTGLGDKAVVWNDPFLSGVYAIRGSEWFEVQWVPRAVTLGDAQAESVIRALFKTVPR